MYFVTFFLFKLLLLIFFVMFDWILLLIVDCLYVLCLLLGSWLFVFCILSILCFVCFEDCCCCCCLLFIFCLLLVCCSFVFCISSMLILCLLCRCSFVVADCDHLVGAPYISIWWSCQKFCCNVVWGLQYLIHGKHEFWFCILCCHCFLWGIGGWGGLSTSANCSMKSVSRSLSTSYRTFKNLTKVYFLYTFLGFFLKSGKKIALGSYLGA